MKTRLLTGIAAISFCVGCANISTLNRTTTLAPGEVLTGTKLGSTQNIKDREDRGLAIHLDAPQRLVLSKRGIVCAEPSPDALQAYAASQSLSFLVPEEVSVALANALAANAGSIGLRTQSITLMRDHLYRICEAAYSGFITEFDVAQLIRRSQDLTLGVLAIEQLSGAIKAHQAAISTKANADASANLGATQASLAAAREKERLAKEISVAAEEKKAAQDLVLKKKQGLVDNPPPGQDPVRLQEDLDKEKNQLGLITAEAADAKRNYEDTQKITRKIEENLGKAMMTAFDEAQGETKLSGGEGSSKIDSNTAQHISWAATQIVEKIVNKDHIVDSCISLINKFATAEVTPQKPMQLDEGKKEQVKQLRSDIQNLTLQMGDVEHKRSKEKNRLKDGPKELLDKVDESAGDQLYQLERQRNKLSSQLFSIEQEEKAVEGIRSIRNQCIEVISKHLATKKPTP